MYSCQNLAINSMPRFHKDWLTNGYSDKTKVEKDCDLNILSQSVAEALLGVHLRSNLADKPSEMDIQLLKDIYCDTRGNISLNQLILVILILMSPQKM